MIKEKGNISISTENLFPIIKKWLYSDKDIFVRELISNGCDAISKHKQLVGMGEAEESTESYKITLTVNKKAKTLTFSDNGLGMSAEEVKKYINQVAFSGAKDFLEKYQEKADTNEQIIGHFGLGFYSAFMIGETVQIETKSYNSEETPVKWISDGTSEYSMEEGTRTTRGTDITLNVMKAEKEFLDYNKIKAIADKYCSFLPIEIYVIDANAKKDEKEDKEESEPTPINDTTPLWTKRPSECSDEEYKEFYKKTFMDFQEPLFWIHLNMDYPFKLKGILYFPKLKHEFETMEGQIKLFNNQVFVADNIKEVIPEFLMLLKGAIDCPDLPLNVSRSFLQNDGYVKKISNHITKKVADKLKKLYNKERESYNKYWDDINPFVKYGCLKEEKFYDKVKEAVIYKTIKDEYISLEEYLTQCEDKHKNKVYYITDQNKQAQYIEMFKEHDLNAVYLNTMIDSSFINFIESKDSEVKFEGIDADISDTLKTDEAVEGYDEMIEYVKKSLNKDDLKIEVAALKTKSISAMIKVSEQAKRFQDMSKMYGQMGMSMPSDETLVLNSTNPIISKLKKMDESTKKEDTIKYVYQMALLSAGKLDAKGLQDFMKSSANYINESID